MITSRIHWSIVLTTGEQPINKVTLAMYSQSKKVLLSERIPVQIVRVVTPDLTNFHLQTPKDSTAFSRMRSNSRIIMMASLLSVSLLIASS